MYFREDGCCLVVLPPVLRWQNNAVGERLRFANDRTANDTG